jgi:hypothetical protein
VSQRPEVGLLLDEMFSPAIAAELGKLGHDVIAAADRPDPRSKSDEEIFAWASTATAMVAHGEREGLPADYAAGLAGRATLPW